MADRREQTLNQQVYFHQNSDRDCCLFVVKFINEFQACFTGIRIVGRSIRHVFGCIDERVSPLIIFRFVYIYKL